jgi:hypothetical protein
MTATPAPSMTSPIQWITWLQSITLRPSPSLDCDGDRAKAHGHRPDVGIADSGPRPAEHFHSDEGMLRVRPAGDHGSVGKEDLTAMSAALLSCFIAHCQTVPLGIADARSGSLQSGSLHRGKPA